MQKNMGIADLLARTLAAVGVGVLYVTGAISGTLAIVLGAFAVAFVSTSVVAWCPLYAPLGISTRGERG
jgi:hypothetical protein